MTQLSTLWLSGNNLQGPIPTALGTQGALDTLDLRANPLTWPPPASLAEPRPGLTVLLPDTDKWLPPAPAQVTAEPGADGSLEIAWEHPAAGTGFLVDDYMINYRLATDTGGFAQQGADESPAVIEGLTSGSTYLIFVTATNPQGTSAPSPVITVTALVSADSHAPDYYTDLGNAPTLRSHIQALADHGIFTGTDCGVNLFCPHDDVLKWEVAVWLARELNRVGDNGVEPPSTPNRFEDLSGFSDWSNHINWIAQEGVIEGCQQQPGRFCPTQRVSRAQMATMLANAYRPLRYVGAAPAFTDISTSPHRADIIAIAEARITLGCRDNPPRFCPDDRVSRSQMAAFIDRARNARQEPPPPPDSRPVITSIARGIQSLTVHWRRAAGDTSAIDGWEINYQQHHMPDTADTHDVSTSTIPTAGATLTGLEHYTLYDVSVRAYTNNPNGTRTYKTPSAITTATTLEAVKLIALEVTQGLQNWQGEITLVQGKRTVVRAFLESNTGQAVNVTPKLYLVDNNGNQRVITQDPLTPVNGVPEDSQPHPIDGYSRVTFTAPESIDSKVRGQYDGAALFLISDLASWIGHDNPDAQDAQKTREITYRLEVDEGAVCEEEVNPRHECEATLTFTQVPVPRVAVVPAWIHGNMPDDAVIAEQMQRIATIMPVPRIDYVVESPVVYSVPVPRPSPGTIFMTAYGVRQPNVTGEAFLAIAQGLAPGAVIGADGEAPGRVIGKGGEFGAVWYTEGVDGLDSAGAWRNVGAHEFAHVVGVPHAFEDHRLGADQNDLVRRFEVLCSTEGQFFDPEKGGWYLTDLEEYPLRDFPHQFEFESESDGERTSVALLGDLGPEALPWGLDTRLLARYAGSGSLSLSEESEELVFVSPSTSRSLMSYCNQYGRGQAWWIDQYHHSFAFRKLRSFQWVLERDSDLLQARSVLFASGSFTEAAASTRSSNAGGGAMAVSVDPLYAVTAAWPATPSTVGEYALELLDAAGTVVAAARFDASAPLEAQPSASGRTRTAYWSVALPDPPQFVSYRISAAGQALAEAAASASAPAVSVLAPVAGQSLAGSTVAVSWSASDADGDALIYRVDYSIDGGASYETIAAGLTGTSLSVERRWLAGSRTARFRVIASDGVRSAWAQSAVVEVAASAPRVVIMSPAPEGLVAGYGTVVLDAAAIDTEDGSLGDGAIVWSSSIDGVVANSAYAVLTTAELSVGVHTLTATATDSSAMTGSATVTVEVRATNEAPVASDDTAYAQAGRRALADVLANDSDADDRIGSGRLSVLAGPSMGTARIARTPGARDAVEYLGDRGGYDVFVYEVCDRLRNCRRAETTIVVRAARGVAGP